jgi:ferritin
MQSFQDILYKELRTTSEIDSDTYSELDKSQYKEKVIGLINKALTDEITAASVYLAMAQVAPSENIAKQLEEHAQDEFDHYKKLITFAYAHGFGQSLEFNMEYSNANDIPEEIDEILDIVQSLEQEAIQDYKTIALIAREQNDIETEEFFMDLMEDEMSHFDELARYTNQKRELGN